MEVDSEFIIEFANLHKTWNEETKPKHHDKNYSGIPPLDELEAMYENPNYFKLEAMLAELNPEEWLDFLTIYYLGKGVIETFDDGREKVKKFGKHDVNQILAKSNLANFLMGGDRLR